MVSDFQFNQHLLPRLISSRGLVEEISATEREQAAIELEVCREWVNEHVFPTKVDSKDSAIAILRVHSTNPDDRDVLSGPFQARLGVEELTFGSWLGFPELILPSE